MLRGGERKTNRCPPYTSDRFTAPGQRIKEGDWIKARSQRFGVWHHGIVQRVYPVSAAGGWAVDIAHNMKESGVALTGLDSFAGGSDVLLERRALSLAHVSEIRARVAGSLGKPYNLFAANCEHFASFAFFGKPESKSVNALGGFALLALGTVIAAKIHD